MAAGTSFSQNTQNTLELTCYSFQCSLERPGNMLVIQQSDIQYLTLQHAHSFVSLVLCKKTSKNVTLQHKLLWSVLFLCLFSVQKLLIFLYNKISSEDSNPDMEPYVSICRNRDIPGVYGIRPYLWVSKVLLYFVQHSIINFQHQYSNLCFSKPCNSLFRSSPTHGDKFVT